MKMNPIDTNVIVRFLIEDPDKCDPKWRGVFSFFPRVEKGEIDVYLPELALFQVYFVLTSYYRVPVRVTASKLCGILKFKGIKMDDKQVILTCFEILEEKNDDIVDCYLTAWCSLKNRRHLYSFDHGFDARGIIRLPIE